MKTKALLTVGCLFFHMVVIAQPLIDPDESVCTREEKDVIALVTQIYEEISSDGEREVNWETIRSFFIEGAIIILRTSPYDSKQFTVDQFIQDFKCKCSIFSKDPEFSKSRPQGNRLLAPGQEGSCLEGDGHK